MTIAQFCRPVLLGAIALALAFPTVPAVASADTAAVARQDQAETLLHQGLLLAAKGRLEEAVDQYSEALALNPEMLEAYAARGGALGALEDYEGAIADYTAVIELDPEAAAAYGGRGLARYRSGETDAGVDDLWHAAQLFASQDNMNDYHRMLSIIRRLDP